jgi:hypothetical protein
MTTTTSTNGNSNTTNGTGSKPRAAMTPVDAISKVSKILDQLSPADRKRVLAFVSVDSENAE